MIKNKKSIILIIILGILTLYRILLAVKIPLFAQAGAGLDDFLMTRYAIKLIDFKWLGSFNYLTLVKSVSFSLFLAIGYWLGIPYSILLILTYIGAIIAFVLAIKKIVNNKYFLSILYVVLLFSPVMFHIENTQKIYRGGLIVAIALLVISSFIGMYNNRNENNKKLIIWTLIASLSLSFFWFIKEDSVWILPFCLGASWLSIIWLILNRKKVKKLYRKLILFILPFIVLSIIISVYCGINYKLYGEYTITDRTGTYYKEVLHDFLAIDNKKIDEVWITKDSVYKAIDVSPTLQSIKSNIDEMYENSWALVNGEFRGDMFFWAFRQMINDAGIYDNGGKEVNKFYKKIHVDLEKAFKNGQLKKVDAIFLSSVGKGIEKKDVKYFKETAWPAYKSLLIFSEHETGIYEANGEYSDIVLMQYVTNSNIIYPNTNNDIVQNTLYKKTSFFVNQVNKIVSIYQKTGLIIFFISIICLIVLVIKTILDAINKKYEYLSLTLIILGLVFTIIILFVGVLWFVSWFGFTKFRYTYNYACGLIPLIHIVELLSIYSIFKIVNIKSILPKLKRMKK